MGVGEAPERGTGADDVLDVGRQLADRDVGPLVDVRQADRSDVLADALPDGDVPLGRLDEVLVLGPGVRRIPSAGEDQGEGEGQDDAADPDDPLRARLVGQDRPVVVVVHGRGANGAGQAGGLLGRADRQAAGPLPLAVAQRRGADDLGGGARGLGTLQVDDVRDDDGHVVAGARLEGDLDEPVGGGRGRGRLGEDLLDDVAADEVAEAVGAEEVPVAGAQLAHRQVGLVVGLPGHDPGDEGPLRVVLGLLRGDPVLVDELLDEGVVLGDLAELPVPEQVRPGVADVGHGQLVAGAEHGDRRAAHPAQLRVVLHGPAEAGVGLAHGLLQGGQGLLGADALAVERGELADDQRAGDVAGGVAAHAVGQDEEVRTGIPAVLVPGLRSQPEVGPRRVAQGDGHGFSPAVPAWCARSGSPSRTRPGRRR